MTDKPIELIQAEVKLREAFAAYDALKARVVNGEVWCRAHPGDLRNKRLLADLKVRMHKAHNRALDLLRAYERVHDRLGGEAWPLEQATYVWFGIAKGAAA